MEPVKSIKKPRVVKVQPIDRKPNKWSDHVKKYCVDNDMKYRDALRSEDCKTKYSKSKVFKIE